jgi:hypothetical protein
VATIDLLEPVLWPVLGWSRFTIASGIGIWTCQGSYHLAAQGEKSGTSLKKAAAQDAYSGCSRILQMEVHMQVLLMGLVAD